MKILKSYFSYSSLFESLGLIRNLRKDILLIWIFIVILWSWDCRHKWNNQLEQECQIHIPRRAHPTAHEHMPGSMCLQGGRILSTHAQEHAHLGAWVHPKCASPGVHAHPRSMAWAVRSATCTSQVCRPRTAVRWTAVHMSRRVQLDRWYQFH